MKTTFIGSHVNDFDQLIVELEHREGAFVERTEFHRDVGFAKDAKSWSEFVAVTSTAEADRVMETADWTMEDLGYAYECALREKFVFLEDAKAALLPA